MQTKVLCLKSLSSCPAVKLHWRASKPAPTGRNSRKGAHFTKLSHRSWFYNHHKLELGRKRAGNPQECRVPNKQGGSMLEVSLSSHMRQNQLQCSDSSTQPSGGGVAMNNVWFMHCSQHHSTIPRSKNPQAQRWDQHLCTHTTCISLVALSQQLHNHYPRP